MCKKMFSGEVKTRDGVFEEFAPLEEAESLEEWRDTYISLLMDILDSNPDAERVAEKLQNGDYEISTEFEEDTEYSYILVDLTE